MASIQQFLLHALEKENWPHRADFLPRKTHKQIIASPWYPMLKEVYQELGGQDQPPPVFLNFTAELPGWALMLDTEINFNRYRNITLRSELYDELPSFPLNNYRRFCRMYEKDCIKVASAGHLWTNKEAEFHFGKSEAPGDLGLNGSAGWKLRAYQDFYIDLVQLMLPYKIMRMTVYDQLMVSGKMVKLKELLLSQKSASVTLLGKYITRMAIRAKT